MYSGLSSISPHIGGILGVIELSLYSCKSSVTADPVLCLRQSTQGGMASQAPLLLVKYTCSVQKYVQAVNLRVLNASTIKKQ